MHSSNGFVIIFLPGLDTDIGNTAPLLKNNSTGICIFRVTFAEVIDIDANRLWQALAISLYKELRDSGHFHQAANGTAM